MSLTAAVYFTGAVTVSMLGQRRRYASNRRRERETNREEAVYQDGRRSIAVPLVSRRAVACSERYLPWRESGAPETARNDSLFPGISQTEF